jgi:hypothetical protein
MVNEKAKKVRGWFKAGVIVVAGEGMWDLWWILWQWYKFL